MRITRRVLILLAGVLLVPAVVTAQPPTETVEYYALDAVGSVRVVFDASGNILGRMDYGPFGQELTGGTGLPHQRFAGLFRDGEAGLDHAQARSYQVRTGRFSTVDPLFAGLFEPQGWNRYSYSFNAPLDYTDPSGLLAEDGRPVFRSGVEVCLSCFLDFWKELNLGWGGGAAFDVGLGSWSPAGRGRGVDLGQSPTISNNTPSDTPNPGPNPPGGNPPRPNPPPADPKPPEWRRVLQCGATTAQSINAAWLFGVDDTKVGQILGGNDLASLSEWVFGPDHWGGGVDVATGRAIQMGARVGMHAPVLSEKIPLKERAGRFESTRYYNGSLARTPLGAQILKWGVRLSGAKAIYDAGTFLGSLGRCSGVI